MAKLINEGEREKSAEQTPTRGQERDKEKSVRLGGKNKIKDQPVRSSVYRQVQKILQDGRRSNAKSRRSSGGSGGQFSLARPARIFSQRVAVRLTYARNKGDGTWRAHGNYLERESATGRNTDGRGFGHEGEDMPIAKTLDGWQQAKDPNVFKLIVSPENGEKLDLREYTKAYVAELEKKLGTKLEWVGADHYNTDNPHVHVAVRGRDETGRPLVIPREFIKGPLRTIAQELATERVGHRTSRDVSDARQQQVKQHRWTDLDRMLVKVGQGGVVDFGTPVAAAASPEKKELRLQLLQRLSTLESMGLAARGEGGRWVLDPAAETILRERQKANDRLKVLHSHRAMASDPRLPLAPLPAGEPRIAGRLIGTGLDDASQKPYMLMETLRGSVIYVYQSPSAERARGEGMKPGDFVVLTQRERVDSNGKPTVSQFVRSHGPADAALTEPARLRAEIRHHLARTGELPERTTWGGWLGTFHGAMAKEAAQLQARGLIAQKEGRYFMEPKNNSRPKGHGR